MFKNWQKKSATNLYFGNHWWYLLLLIIDNIFVDGPGFSLPRGKQTVFALMSTGGY